MLTGLPQMCPSVSTMLDRPLVLRLTGPGGEWMLRPGDLQLVVEQDGPDAAAVVVSSAVDFVLWGTTRVPWRERVSVHEDTGYAGRVLDAINIV